MFHGRNDIGQRVLGGVDLAIDFATLGEYGLEPYSAVGSRRQRLDRRPATSRRPGWEARTATPRGACGTSLKSKPVDFRAAIRRYAA